MKTLLKWWQRGRIRIAQEQHAQWKARHAALKEALETGVASYRRNPFNVERMVEAAGKEAKHLERVEAIIRESQDR